MKYDNPILKTALEFWIISCDIVLFWLTNNANWSQFDLFLVAGLAAKFTELRTLLWLGLAPLA